MLQRPKEVVNRRHRSSKTVVRIINIFQIEQQTNMVLFGLIKHLAQITGYLYLTTQTIAMVSIIIWGIFVSLALLAWKLTLLSFEVIFSQGLVLLIIWFWIFRRCDNKRIYSLMTSMCGKRAFEGILYCQQCGKEDCNLFFDQCCHSFHTKCIQLAEYYIDAKVCPKCLDQKHSKRVNPNIIAKILKGNKLNKLSLINFVIIGAIINGIYGYFESYWNFPDCLFGE